MRWGCKTEGQRNRGGKGGQFGTENGEKEMAPISFESG